MRETEREGEREIHIVSTDLIPRYLPHIGQGRAEP